jgi:MFS family permease
MDSPYAWWRLCLCVLISTIGGVGMWSFPVALPTVQLEFGVLRADASLPFTLVMVGFALGSVLIGRLVDRFGVVLPLCCGAISMALGYIAAGYATSLWQLALAHGLLIGVGASASFGPLIADISHWFVKRRGIAVGLASAGNYISGALWPPVLQYFTATDGWRVTHIGVGLFCAVVLLPLAFTLRRRPPPHRATSTGAQAAAVQNAFGFSPNALLVLLSVAGVACCVAMSMPQVHIVAYCGDLGYGVARGAEMLSLMLGFGIVSRVAAGFIADHIGGLWTLLLSSVLQGVALFLYFSFEGLASLYVISALFGLFQGGIVPMYAVIVRDFFSPREAATRLGVVLMATLFGMALGGWMSGLVFDLTGSYRAAFLNGLAWNLVNVSIVVWLLARFGQRNAYA